VQALPDVRPATVVLDTIGIGMINMANTVRERRFQLWRQPAARA
jgi:hypothetical protein